MLTKEKLVRAIHSFPDEFTLEELIEKLILLNKIERGDKESQNNQVVSDQELDSEMEKWFG